jgi:hypothetical protein
VGCACRSSSGGGVEGALSEAGLAKSSRSYKKKEREKRKKRERQTEREGGREEEHDLC